MPPAILEGGDLVSSSGGDAGASRGDGTGGSADDPASHRGAAAEEVEEEQLHMRSDGSASTVDSEDGKADKAARTEFLARLRQGLSEPDDGRAAAAAAESRRQAAALDALQRCPEQMACAWMGQCTGKLSDEWHLVAFDFSFLDGGSGGGSSEEQLPVPPVAVSPMKTGVRAIIRNSFWNVEAASTAGKLWTARRAKSR